MRPTDKLLRQALAIEAEQAQHQWIMPIPGTTKIHPLEENVAAAGVELTDADLRQVEEAVSKIEIQGARYPESSEKTVDR